MKKFILWDYLYAPAVAFDEYSSGAHERFPRQSDMQKILENVTQECESRAQDPWGDND